jgi:thiamine-monophosphate kinase
MASDPRFHLSDDHVETIAVDAADRWECAVHFGEDFELVCTVPESDLDVAREASPTRLTRVGTATESGVTVDGDALPDRGYTHQ